MKQYPAPRHVCEHLAEEMRRLLDQPQPFNKKRVEFWIGCALTSLLWRPPAFTVDFDAATKHLNVRFFDQDGEEVTLVPDDSVGIPGIFKSKQEVTP